MNLFTYNLFGLKPKAFGLEIEDCSLKAVWLKKKRNKFEMASCARKIIPRGIVQAGQIVNPQKLTEGIKELLASAQPGLIKTKNVVFSIPEAKAFVRTIKIPRMSDAEAREAVKWETEANIPISLDRVYLDWQAIDEKETMEEILVVAVPKNIVDSYFQAVRAAGLFPLAVEVDIMATIRSLAGPEKGEHPVLIADVGAENTSLAICRNQIPYFTSSIPLSGNTFTEALQKEVGVSWEKAEEMKFKFGTKEKEEEEIFAKVFKPLIENLASEIEKSTSFFTESIDSRNKVEKVILAGGGALLSGLAGRLAERIGKEVEVGSPMSEIEAKNFPYEISSRDLLSYSTAIGLALRGADYED